MTYDGPHTDTCLDSVRELAGLYPTSYHSNISVEEKIELDRLNLRFYDEILLSVLYFYFLRLLFLIQYFSHFISKFIVFLTFFTSIDKEGIVNGFIIG